MVDAVIRVGLVGTGFVAKLRSQALLDDPRAHLVAVSGHLWDATCEFAANFNAEPCRSDEALIERDDLDLVILSSINRDRAALARTALERHKHVVAEYPLALDPTEARQLLALARQQNRLLHVEHIELLGGLHLAFLENLPHLGTVSDVRYATVTPKHPAPQRWTYSPELFGFPFVGALSRLHRLVSTFGRVRQVSAQARFWPATNPEYYAACLCKAQLSFESGVLADVLYAKGDRFHHRENLMEVRGDGGTLVLGSAGGQLYRGEDMTEIPVGSRRGLFAKDTHLVLDYLCEDTPLYIRPEASIYTLEVADAVRRAAETESCLQL